MAEREGLTYELTAPAILGYASLTEPRAFQENGQAKGDPRYEVELLLRGDHVDLAPLKEALKDLVRKHTNAPFSTVSFPLKNGDQEAEAYKAKHLGTAKEGNRDFVKGHVILKAASSKDYPPSIAGTVNGKPVSFEDRKAHAHRFFAGAEAYAQVYFKFRPASGDRTARVTAYINQVYVTGEGKKLVEGGRSNAAMTFGKHVGRVTQVDPREDIV